VIVPLEKEPTAHPNDVPEFKYPKFLPFSRGFEYSEIMPITQGEKPAEMKPKSPINKIKVTGSAIKEIKIKIAADPNRLKMINGFRCPIISDSDPIITTVTALTPKNTPAIRLA